VLICGLVSLSASCILDDDRCDANQVALEGDLTVCECVPGAIKDPRGYGCTLCGANEVVKENKCVCDEGYARTAPDAACEESMLGASCSADAPCPAAFPRCATGATGAGYCTTEGCTGAADCAEGWVCIEAEPMNYCGKPPSGQGAPCTTSADCEGFEASYCEAVESKTCLVPNCATGESSCFGDYSCCDIMMIISTIPSLCVPPVALNDGVCPLGARKVEQ
jgi:hypothetical protein